MRKRVGYDDEETIEIEDCVCIAETERALQVTGVKEAAVWIPRTQIHDDSEVYCVESKGTLVVRRWWAEKEGWI